MSQILKRNAIQKIFEFDKSRIVAYQECALSFCDSAHRTGLNPTTTMRIWNQGVVGFHAERHAGSQSPPID